MHRRGFATAVTAGLLLLLPTAAVAQDATTEVGVGTADVVEEREPAQEGEDEVGIGESASIVCRGTVAVSVVDLDGAPVDGAVLSVANQQITGSGTVEVDCGEVGATLLAAPDGYAPAGPTSMNVPVRQAATSSVAFAVDPVEVLGTQFEQPTQPEAAPDTAAPAAEAGPDEQSAPELAATGPEDAQTLMLAALLLGLLGTVLVAGAPALARGAEQR